MATIDGAALVPDLSKSLGAALNIFGTKQTRDAEDVERAKQAEIAKQVELTIPDPGADPGAQRGIEEAALLRLGVLDPAIAKATRATLEAGDAEATATLQAEAEKGARNAAFVSKQPDFASKRRAITTLASDAAARGEPLDRFIQLQNMDEGQLDLELQRMEIAAQDIQTVLKPTEKFTPVLGAGGDIIGQISTTTGKVIADPRTAAAVKPTTDIGKARADLKGGLITQEDFNTIKSTPAKFQTDVGKLIGDKQIATAMFGADSPQVKAFDEAIKSDGKGEAPKLTDVSGARKEFTKLSGDFIKLRDAIGKVEQAALNPSAAGDLSLIFNFMKIQDPGSTVREGEFATAQNAAGVPERARAQYNSVVSGERLTVNQRQDFVDTATRAFDSQTDKQIQLEDSFRGISERQGMTPEDVVIDFIGEGRPTEEVIIGPQEGATATNPKTGAQIIFRGGQWQNL